MAIQWTAASRRDLERLHGSLAPVNAPAARRVVGLLVTGVGRLAAHPRLGVGRSEFDPREVRAIIVGEYEVRYEVRDAQVIVLRIWHTREDR